MPFFALLFSLFSVDLLMSLLPTWYSTILEFTLFQVLSEFLGFLILLMMYEEQGFIQGYWDDHVHDVGKFLKASLCLGLHFTFSQFMLIWYANIPKRLSFLMRSEIRLDEYFLASWYLNLLCPLWLYCPGGQNELKVGWPPFASYPSYAICGHLLVGLPNFLRTRYLSVPTKLACY